ncbi:uncharacterized protein [Chironomus tepperi]|uniref:uncharacterized protein n=1 Tax=Chironomus tepperi TaxID=113505 RepID=UPI00391F2857
MAESYIKECRDKFHQVLTHMKPQDLMKDDTFLEKMQTYLSQTEYSDFIKDPVTMKWIETSINAFDDPESIPSQQIANFTLKIMCFICSNEWNFVEMKEKGLLDKIRVGIEKHPQLQKAPIKLKHLQLLHAISQHSIGLHWIKQTKVWNIIINYYQTTSSIYLIRDSSIFFFDILVKFSELMKDDDSCTEALEAIMAPILNYKHHENNQSIVVDDSDFSLELTPSINVLSQILLLCVESNKRTRLAYFILLKYRLENKLWVAQDAFQTDLSFLSSLIRAQNVSNIARLTSMDIPPSDEKATDLPLDIHALHFYNLTMFCMNRQVPKAINTVAETHHTLWFKLGDRAPKEVILENHDLYFGDQVTMIQTFPILYIIKSRYQQSDQYIIEVCSKIFKKSCEHTIRMLYQYRDALSHENFDFVADLAVNCIQSIISVKKYLKRDRATLALQIFIYVLKGYVQEPVDDSGSGCGSGVNIQLVLQAPNLLSALLNALNVMIDTFKFSWKECIESTEIVPLLLELLENSNLSSRHIVESFKLIQTSIEHFLAPNLALLMDKLEGSGMENLGPTIYKRLHDISWEVRDSVLELLHAIVVISDEKFPPFQKHIINNKICQTVEIVARNDSEPYVRASALKVLAAMIKIRSFWEQALHDLDVKKYAVEILGNESEGVVRREAVACLTAVYNYRQVPHNCLDLIFSIMAHCAVNDFYWEVRVNALQFWCLVIERQFAHQGMINGTFPAVTFSKEHKKIITLNDKEIQLRLRKVLNELSVRGCLGILLECLQDSDLEVINKAVSVIDKMSTYLNKYDFIDEYKRKTVRPEITKKPVIDSNYADFKMIDDQKNVEVRNTADIRKTTEVCVSAENGEIQTCANSVIDQILKTDDITLLTNTYKENLKITSEPCNIGEIDGDLFKKFASVSSDDFLDFIIATDMQQLIRDKSEWLQHSETFSTLLDDVLRSFGQNVDLDCY